MRKQGFVRVRVDGETYDLADVPKLNRRQNHEIAIVVDRLVVRATDRGRLADSIETALKTADGVVEVVRQSGSPRSRLFSERYACPKCGLSLPELEPRMFSFNSPYGACPECTGLGTRTEFDLDLVMPDRSKPLRDGAILPFVYKSGEVKEWWPDVLTGVGEAIGFDAQQPASELTQ